MKKAYVENGVVIEAVGNPAVFISDYAIRFALDCPDAVTAGWTYDGTYWKAPVIPPEPVPSCITIRQCCLQLEIDGVLDDVESAVLTMPKLAQIEWQRATEVQRSNPLVPAMQYILGWDDARVDQFYTEGSQL